MSSQSENVAGLVIPLSAPDIAGSLGSVYWQRRLAVAGAELTRAARAVARLESGGRVQAAAVVAQNLLVTGGLAGEEAKVRFEDGAAARLRAIRRWDEEPDLAFLEVRGELPEAVALEPMATGDVVVIGFDPRYALAVAHVEEGADVIPEAGQMPGGLVMSLESGGALGLIGQGGALIPASRIRRAGAALGLSLAAAAAEEAEEEGLEAEADPADYDDRNGYNAGFLGFAAPLPAVESARAADVLAYRNTRGELTTVLPYTNFSVVMSRSRRMALVTAVNIDGSQLSAKKRSGDPWSFDPRISRASQIGNAIYKKNHLDRGHLVRRLDPVWGPLADRADLDTFHFTNSAPQHKDLNQKTWNDLEEHIYAKTMEHRLKVSVFTGPVFSAADVPYRGILIPLEFWKVVAMVKEDGTPSVTAYLLSQADMMGGLEFAFGQYRTYQLPVAEVERRTGLNFGALGEFDPLGGGGTEAALEIQRPEDARL